MHAVAECLDAYREDGAKLWHGDFFVTPQVNDELLSVAYLRFKAEGTLSKVFHEGEAPSLKWYLNHFLENKNVSVLACFKSLDSAVDFCGLAWFNQRVSVGGLFEKCECGHCYFTKYHDLVTPVICSRLGIEWTFRNNREVLALFGCTPVPNKAAWKCARRIGFELVGPIESFTAYQGEPCAAYVGVLTREHWEQVKESRYGSVEHL